MNETGTSSHNLKWLFLALSSFILCFFAGEVHAQGINKQKLLLQHKDPEIRALQAEMLGRTDAGWAVKELIERLNDPSQRVRDKSHTALQRITGKSFDSDYKKWKNWFEEKGSSQFPTRGNASPGSFPSSGENATSDSSRGFLNSAMWIAGIALLVLLFSFALVGGYRLKQLKQTMRKANECVEQVEEVTDSSDEVIEELEQKKVELRDFLSRLKEEKEGEIERHAELLQQNSSRKIREEMRSLRERAEKEVTHTLNEQQNGVSQRLKREIRDLKKEMLDEIKEEHEKYREQAESYRIFLEGSFLDVSGKEEEALHKYDQTLDNNPEHTLALQRKGGVLRKKGRYEEAIENFEDALEQSPESPSIYYDLSATYAQMGRQDKMLEFLQKSVSINSEYKDEALNDESFREFWDQQEFKDLTET